MTKPVMKLVMQPRSHHCPHYISQRWRQNTGMLALTACMRWLPAFELAFQTHELPQDVRQLRMFLS